MNNKELVNAGHELAKAIGADTPIIEIAKMVTRLATALDVQQARANALAAELKQSKIDADCYKKGMEASNERLVQLAAENAGLKVALSAVIDRSNAPDYQSIGMGCGVEDNGLQTDGYNACEYGWREAMERIYSEVIPEELPETPATDAFLAEVRAQARNELIDELEARFTELSQSSPTPELRSGAAGAAGFVSTFRKGVQS